MPVTTGITEATATRTGSRTITANTRSATTSWTATAVSTAATRVAPRTDPWWAPTTWVTSTAATGTCTTWPTSGASVPWSRRTSPAPRRACRPPRPTTRRTGRPCRPTASLVMVMAVMADTTARSSLTLTSRGSSSRKHSEYRQKPKRPVGRTCSLWKQRTQAIHGPVHSCKQAVKALDDDRLS